MIADPELGMLTNASWLGIPHLWVKGRKAARDSQWAYENVFLRLTHRGGKSQRVWVGIAQAPPGNQTAERICVWQGHFLAGAKNRKARRDAEEK